MIKRCSAHLRMVDVQTKINELDVTIPNWSEFCRIGNLTKLRHDPVRGFYPVHYESGLLLYALIASLRPSTILEIGTGRGFSSICMAQALVDHAINGRIVTVDPIGSTAMMKWPIDEGDGNGPQIPHLSRKDVWERHLPPAVLDRIEVRHGNSVNVLSQLEMESFRADFIYIDGDHTYSGVAHDFYASLRLAARPFHILLDDYTEKSNRYGVRQLVDDEVQSVFNTELISTHRSSLTKESSEIDHALILIDSHHVTQPIESAFSSRRIGARIFAYRKWMPLFAWYDRIRAAQPLFNRERRIISQGSS